MRISAWLCLLQQSLCTCSVLAAAGKAGGLPRPGPVRLLLTSLAGGVLTLLALMGLPLVRFGVMGGHAMPAPVRVAGAHRASAPGGCCCPRRPWAASWRG